MSNRLPVQGNSAGRPATPRAAQHDLDRLAGGDLSPSERRRLLAALADEPDGWQRCALAFLEAQSWRQASRQLTAEPSSTSRGPQASLSRPLWRRGARPLAAGIAAAAAVLAAVFCGGLAIGRATVLTLSPTTLPQIADDRLAPQAPAISGDAEGASQTAVADSSGGNAGGRRQDARTVLHVLGFIHVPGEDGARHAVPILAAPGLKIDAPQRQPATLAAAEGAAAPSDLKRTAATAVSGPDGEPLRLPLAAGQRVAIPADWVSGLAQGHSVY